MKYLILVAGATIFTVISIVIYKQLPNIRLILKIQSVRRELRSFKKKWIKFEKIYFCKEECRRSFLKNPDRLASTLSIADQLHGTEFTEGLALKDFSAKLQQFPDIAERKQEEYLAFLKEYFYGNGKKHERGRHFPNKIAN